MIVVTVTPVSHRAMTATGKAALAVTLLAAASAGVWHGTQALVAHVTEPPAAVSYASPDAIAHTLAGADHTPAKQGAFLDAASIQTPDVVSVVVAVP